MFKGTLTKHIEKLEIHTHINSHVHTYIHGHVHTYIHGQVRTYIHTYFHLASEMIRTKPNPTNIKVLGNDTEKLL